MNRKYFPGASLSGKNELFAKLTGGVLMPVSSERRKNLRYPVKKEVHVYVAHESTYSLCDIVDISISGLSFFCNHHNVTSVEQLSILYSKELLWDLINIPVKLIWTTSEHGEEPGTRVGVEFADLSDRRLPSLHNLIANTAS